MNYTIHERKEHGAPYTRRTLIVDGVVIYECISPISDAEAAERVHLHKHPAKAGVTPAQRWAAGVNRGPGRPKSNFHEEDEAA